MKTTRIILATTILSSLTLPQAFGFEQIIRPLQSARSMGMGGTRITTGLYEDNFYGNPARATANPAWKVTIFDPSFEANKDGISNAGDLTDIKGDDLTPLAGTTGDNNHIRIQTTMPSFYIPPNKEKERKMAIAAGLLTSVQADVSFQQTATISPQVISDIGPAVTLARQFMPENQLSVGVTTHMNYRLSTNEALNTAELLSGQSFKFSEEAHEGAHIEFDVGSTYELPAEWKGFEFQVGASVNNMLGGGYKNLGLDLSKTVADGPKRQPRAYNVGINAHRKDWGVWSDTLFAFEVTDIGNNGGGSLFRTLHIGAESHWKLLAARLGINQGYWCAGFGVNLKFFQIDAASYGEEMSLNSGGFEDRRYALRLAFQI